MKRSFWDNTMEPLSCITVCCVHNNDLIIDRESIKDTCPPVLKRLLDIPCDSRSFTAWAEPNKDSQGRFTFAKSFGITRSHLAACITFIRTGHVEYLGALIQTFEIFGGCDRLDKYIQEKRKQDEIREKIICQEKIMRHNNPLRPEDDFANRFEFRAAFTHWSPPTSDWTTVSALNPNESGTLFWWRRPRGNHTQNTLLLDTGQSTNDNDHEMDDI